MKKRYIPGELGVMRVPRHIGYHRAIIGAKADGEPRIRVPRKSRSIIVAGALNDIILVQKFDRRTRRGKMIETQRKVRRLAKRRKQRRSSPKYQR